MANEPVYEDVPLTDEDRRELLDAFGVVRMPLSPAEWDSKLSEIARQDDSGRRLRAGLTAVQSRILRRRGFDPSQGGLGWDPAKGPTLEGRRIN